MKLKTKIVIGLAVALVIVIAVIVIVTTQSSKEEESAGGSSDGENTSSLCSVEQGTCFCCRETAGDLELFWDCNSDCSSRPASSRNSGCVANTSISCVVRN